MVERKPLLQAILNTYDIPGVVLSEDSFSKVTTFDVSLPQGHELSSLRNYSKEIALHLGAGSVSITKTSRESVYCVEVWNEGVNHVKIGDMLKSLEFIESDSPLTAVLGKNESGDNIVCDIKSMPHLLIGGDSGTSTAVFFDCVIMSMLRKATPGEARMILIDYSSDGFKKYSGAPHLACPVISDERSATGVLLYLFSELDNRIGLLSKDANALPRIVILFNEFSTLMKNAKPMLMQIVKAFGEKGREAGVHLAMATASTDHRVVTELLKDYLPARVAFKVSDAQHSRLLIDRTGAETLADGCMLYSPAYSAKPVQIQGAYVSGAEISRVVDFLKANNAEPAFDRTLMRYIDVSLLADSPDDVYRAVSDIIGDTRLHDLENSKAYADEDFVDDENILKAREESKKDWDIDW